MTWILVLLPSQLCYLRCFSDVCDCWICYACCFVDHIGFVFHAIFYFEQGFDFLRLPYDAKTAFVLRKVSDFF